MKSRPPGANDKLRTSNFGTGTRGFAAAGDPITAVCVRPGTELAFSREIRSYGASEPTLHKAAIFRQIIIAAAHAPRTLELPDGKTLLLTYLCEDQKRPFCSCQHNQHLKWKRTRKSASLLQAEAIS